MDEKSPDSQGRPELPAVGNEEQKKAGVFSKSKGFLQGAADSLTGKEIPRLVEEFTREMVIVAEGLSEDQAKLQSALALQGEGQDGMAAKLRQIEKQLSEVTKKLDDLSHKAEKRQKGETGLARILRQATWLAGIIAGAWIITSLIRLFGK